MVILILAVLVVLILLASLRMLRPRFLSKLDSQGVPTRTEALVGKPGIVTETVDPNLGTGRVRVLGEDWAAQSDTALPVGTLVHVDGANGIVLNVLPSHPSNDSATSTKGPL
jgi:membrane protein implicated in regulation of membrane protease activity